MGRKFRIDHPSILVSPLLPQLSGKFVKESNFFPPVFFPPFHRQCSFIRSARPRAEGLLTFLPYFRHVLMHIKYLVISASSTQEGKKGERNPWNNTPNIGGSARKMFTKLWRVFLPRRFGAQVKIALAWNYTVLLCRVFLGVLTRPWPFSPGTSKLMNKYRTLCTYFFRTAASWCIIH